MFQIDVPKVRGKMAERGYTITSIADALGMSRATFSYYLSNPGKIPYSVISRLAEMLCDDQGEAERIFFASDLRET
jgi:predicted transcriptional regulator